MGDSWNPALVIINQHALTGLHWCTISLNPNHNPTGGNYHDLHLAQVETEAQHREVKLIAPGHTAVSG